MIYFNLTNPSLGAEQSKTSFWKKKKDRNMINIINIVLYHEKDFPFMVEEGVSLWVTVRKGGYVGYLKLDGKFQHLL